MFMKFLQRKLHLRVPSVTAARDAKKHFRALLKDEKDMPLALFTFEMNEHHRLADEWEDEELPKIKSAFDNRTRHAQQVALRDPR